MFGPSPLRAVTARLDDLRALGVDALWLAPITDTDDRGAISYAVTDYLRVRPDFGTEEDLRSLVGAAHARGIRVLLDVVPNHTSDRHPFYRDAEARGAASPYYRYYLRDERGQATHDFDWVNLKKLDYRNPDVRRLVTEAFAYWVRELGVDGFRVDAAWGVRDRAPDFWVELTASLRRIRPDVFLVAEASARDPYYVRSGFDASYDWTERLGEWAWEHVFDDPSRVGPALDAALASAATPMDRVFRFLNNNDTGDRFVTRYGVARTRLAAVLLHTLPGVALVYTGDETCAEFRPYDDPPPLTWVDRCGFRPLYRRLAALREQLPALRAGAYQRVRVPGHDAVFAFLRDAGDAGRALVVANFGEAARVRLELPEPIPQPDRDALGDRPVTLRAIAPLGLELDVERESAVVLVGRGDAARAQAD
jgi:glycosidase